MAMTRTKGSAYKSLNLCSHRGKGHPRKRTNLSISIFSFFIFLDKDSTDPFIIHFKPFSVSAGKLSIVGRNDLFPGRFSRAKVFVSCERGAGRKPQERGGGKLKKVDE